MCSKQEPFQTPLPLLRHTVPLNDRNCRLTIPVVKGRCAREALLHASDIGVFEYGKSNPTTIKDIYNESENLLESSINSASDWRGAYGDMHQPSLHMRLLDARHM